MVAAIETTKEETGMTITEVMHFSVYPGRIDYVLTTGQGSVSFSIEQRIVITTDHKQGTFRIEIGAVP
jgi:hypothetical protein